jgi:hypothetical protein
MTGRYTGVVAGGLLALIVCIAIYVMYIGPLLVR